MIGRATVTMKNGRKNKMKKLFRVEVFLFVEADSRGEAVEPLNKAVEEFDKFSELVDWDYKVELISDDEAKLIREEK